MKRRIRPLFNMFSKSGERRKVDHKRLTKMVVAPSRSARPASVAAASKRDSAAIEQASPPAGAVTGAVSKPEPATRPERTGPKEQLIAALAVATRITAADSSDLQPPREAALPDQPSHGSSGGGLIALIICDADTKAASALAGQRIAIDADQPISEDDIRASLAAAGATSVEFTTSDAKAIDRFVGGDVHAAVLGLVSAVAGDAFPEVKGFRILRIPLAQEPKN